MQYKINKTFVANIDILVIQAIIYYHVSIKESALLKHKKAKDRRSHEG